VDEERKAMDEQQRPGPDPGETAAPEESGLAERLIRDEFSDAPAHRARFHRDSPNHAASDPAPQGGSAGDGVMDDAAAREELAPALARTAEVPIVATSASAATATAAGAPVIHEEFAAPERTPRFRSHRVGMLAGLGVVGALLAVLVLLGPGSGTPKLPSQSVHDVSPISSSGPRTAAATTPTTAAPTTTSSAPASTTTTPANPNQSETVSTFITYSYVPGSTVPAPAPTTSAATPTTAPPQTTTTTTTPPTTTTTSKPCFLLCLR
jgi:hypothetical protein